MFFPITTEELEIRQAVEGDLHEKTEIPENSQ